MQIKSFATAIVLITVPSMSMVQAAETFTTLDGVPATIMVEEEMRDTAGRVAHPDLDDLFLGIFGSPTDFPPGIDIAVCIGVSGRICSNT